MEWAQLAAATGCRPEIAQHYAADLTAAIEKHGIDNVPEFLAQCAHESHLFETVEENLNYTTPERLMAVWPRRFPSVAEAWSFVRQPSKLANRVYASRMGNGDEASGDGWKYRGRGLIQLTGRDAYTRFGAQDDPSRLLTPAGACDSAGWFWVSKGLLGMSDVTQITLLVNGGYAGLEERVKLTERARAVMKSEASPTPWWQGPIDLLRGLRGGK